MDMKMPRMDGVTATKELLKRHRGKRVPRVVGLTACVLGGDRDRCLEAGMHEVITKPIDINKLETALLDCRAMCEAAAAANAAAKSAATSTVPAASSTATKAGAASASPAPATILKTGGANGGGGGGGGGSSTVGVTFETAKTGARSVSNINAELLREAREGDRARSQRATRSSDSTNAAQQPENTTDRSYAGRDMGAASVAAMSTHAAEPSPVAADGTASSVRGAAAGTGSDIAPFGSSPQTKLLLSYLRQYYPLLLFALYRLWKWWQTRRLTKK